MCMAVDLLARDDFPEIILGFVAVSLIVAIYAFVAAAIILRGRD